MTTTNVQLSDSPAWREADALLIAIFRFTQPAFVSATPDPFDNDLARQLRREARNVEEGVRQTIVPSVRRGPRTETDRAENLLFVDEDLEEMIYGLGLCERLDYGATGAAALREQATKLRETLKVLRKKLLAGD